MLTEVNCPKCNAKLRSASDLTGKTVRCAKCQERFRATPNPAPMGESAGDTQMLDSRELTTNKLVAKPRPAPEAVENLPVLDAMPTLKAVAKLAVKPVAVALSIPAAANAFSFDEAPPEKSKKKKRVEDDDADEEPVAKKKKKTRDAEEEIETVVDEVNAPAAAAFSFDDAPPEPPIKKRSKRSDDDDDEDADEKPKKGRGQDKAEKKGKPVLLIVGAIVVLLLLVGGGIAAFFAFKKPDLAKVPASKAAAAAAEPKAQAKSTAAATEPTTQGKGSDPTTGPKPKPPGKGPKPPAVPKSNLPKAPAGELTLLSPAKKEKFAIDAAPESIKAFRVSGEANDAKVFIARNTFAGFQGQGAIDTIDRYAADTGAKTGSCEVKADGVKWPRPFEASPDGKHIIIEAPVGKLSLYSFDDNKYVLLGVDPFMGQANRKGPLKGLNWKGDERFYVSDFNGSSDEWSVADKKMVKAGPNLPDAEAEAKLVIGPIDEKGELLGVLRDSQIFRIQQGKLSEPSTLPEGSAVPIAFAGSTLADRIKMAVVANIKDTTQFMVYVLNFKDKVEPIAIRLPEGIGAVTGIAWQSVDTLIVTIEGGAAALLIDLEEQYPIGYVKSPSAKAQVFAKGAFNTMWYAVADATGKTQIVSINLDFDGYKKMAEDAKAAKTPTYIVPSEKGLSK